MEVCTVLCTWLLTHHSWPSLLDLAHADSPTEVLWGWLFPGHFRFLFLSLCCRKEKVGWGGGSGAPIMWKHKMNLWWRSWANFSNSAPSTAYHDSRSYWQTKTENLTSFSVYKLAVSPPPPIHHVTSRLLLFSLACRNWGIGCTHLLTVLD